MNDINYMILGKEETDRLVKRKESNPDLKSDILYVRGNLSRLTDTGSRKILVIGSNSPWTEDLKYVEAVIGTLAKKPNRPVIFSGLAYGTDTAVHKTALRYGMTTYGFIGCAIDSMYPRTNAELADEMTLSGGIISIYGPGTQKEPNVFNQMKRLKLAVLMSDAVIIICSKKNGRAMYAAELAHLNGIPLYAIPGKPDDITHQGCNILIKEGKARMVTGEKDILQA